MSYSLIQGFPPQQLSVSKKNKVWRKKCVDFGDSHSFNYNQTTRKSVFAMRINYDLLQGKIHMEDLKAYINPYELNASFIPDKIQHYPEMNSKLSVLKGEESKRLFDYRVVITNPTAVSEIEEAKNEEVNARLQQLIMDNSQSEDEFNQELEKLADYFQYEYQDKREVRGNFLLNHYVREYDVSQLFNKGFQDAYCAGEEVYQCDIVGGEPTIEKLDPRKIRVIRSGPSCYIEDADMIIVEDYLSPGKIVDIYGDQLSKKDIDAIMEGSSNGEGGSFTDALDNYDARYQAIPLRALGWRGDEQVVTPDGLFGADMADSLLPFDMNGNVRVLKVYWKSRRKLKKVKSYDPMTGEEQFNFYPETYIIDPDKGEEEQIFWVNEAWEGTKIAQDIYVNMRPRPVQYNRLSNPSRCHFGIIGTIYTNNGGDEPFSLVDIMKPYNYLYDVIQDRLNKTLAKNMGKVIRLDFAKVPKGWDADKWLYYLTVNGIAVENSFNEGDVGRATGVLAGAMNNASSGVVDASLGQEISQYISLLEWISTRMGEVAGISKQREGQIANRETVGGVERATLQSAHSTEWLFFPHENLKKRVLECFLETAKIALKGRKKKFEYLMNDGSKQLMEIDGDEFAECDYGLVVDNSYASQELNQKLDMLAQAGLQNGMSFSTILKIYSQQSLIEKTRTIEADERRKQMEAERQQQQQMQMQQQQLQAQQQVEQAKMELQYKMHQEDNETKILVAQINAKAEADRLTLMNTEVGITKAEELNFKTRQLELDAKQFDAKLALDKEKHKDDVRLKEKEISQKKNSK